MRHHLLGVGSIGTLLAFHMRKTHPSAPLTLLLKDERAARIFIDGDSTRSGAHLGVERSGKKEEAGEFQVETMLHAAAPLVSFDKSASTSTEPISSLISTLKCTAILPALTQLAPRLSSSSTITLLHNGMGVYDRLVADVFPDRSRRPAFIIGTTTAGVRTKAPFDVVHEGIGSLSFAALPPTTFSSSSKPAPPSLDSTLDFLGSLSSLSAEIVPYTTLEPLLLHKLVMNSVINPLTALHSIPNGVIATERALIGGLVSSICAEASRIVLASSSSLPSDQLHRFETESLISSAYLIANRTATNRSSMLQDFDAGRATEIKFINGRLVELGRQAGVPTCVNETIMEMVQVASGLKQKARA